MNRYYMRFPLFTCGVAICYMLLTLPCRYLYAGQLGVPMQWSSSSPDNESGCLHQHLDACLAAVRNIISFSDEEVDKEIANLFKKDINGRDIFKYKRLTLWAPYPGDPLLMGRGVTIEFNDKGVVKSVDVELRNNPRYAKTFDDYNETGLYTAIVNVIGRPCADKKPLEIYKFFETSIKPHIKDAKPKQQFSEVGVSSARVARSETFQYCGAKLTYESYFVYDTERITLDNPHGAGGHTRIIFE